MEQLNRVELRGIVGSVRENVVSGKVMTRLTVATNLAYKDDEKNVVIETTWHNVLHWSDTSLGLKKGDLVSIVGRIRNQKYTNVNGEEKSELVIQAKEVTKIDEELKMEE